MAENIKITDNTPEVMRKIKGLTGKTLTEFADSATEFTKLRAPVRKNKVVNGKLKTTKGGNHRDSIDWRVFAGWNGPKKSAQVFSQSNYGVYLEFGTRFMAARPHFRVGIDEAIRKFDKDKLWKS